MEKAQSIITNMNREETKSTSNMEERERNREKESWSSSSRCRSAVGTPISNHCRCHGSAVSSVGAVPQAELGILAQHIIEASLSARWESCQPGDRCAGRARRGGPGRGDTCACR